MKKLVFSLLIPFSLFAQLPETDIWLFKLGKKEGKYVYSNPLNITNRVGYDNQPSFSLDGKSVFYVVIDSSKQADIYQYNIGKKTIVNLTKSNVSEYSPTIMPDGKSFSCVVVELDSAQRVWKYNMDGTFNQLLFPNIDSVGYHTWLNSDTMLYYKLTEPHSLRSACEKKEKDVWICDFPTRAFKKTSTSEKFIYGVKVGNSIEYRIYDVLLRESELYAKHESLNEDFIWHPELGLMKSEGAELIRYNSESKQWENVFSFASLGIKKITRFTFDAKNKQLAIVSNL